MREKIKPIDTDKFPRNTSTLKLIVTPFDYDRFGDVYILYMDGIDYTIIRQEEVEINHNPDGTESHTLFFTFDSRAQLPNQCWKISKQGINPYITTAQERERMQPMYDEYTIYKPNL